MASETFPTKFLSLLHSAEHNALDMWRTVVIDGQIELITDNDINSPVLELKGIRERATYIESPADPTTTLGVKLTFFNMIVLNLNRYFSFDVEVLDDKNLIRLFRVSNYQSRIRVRPHVCLLPLTLAAGWNQVRLSLSDFTLRFYGSAYVETLSVRIYGSCRIQSVYFSDRLYPEEDLSPELTRAIAVGARVRSTSHRRWRL